MEDPKIKILVVCQHFYPENFRVNDICFELAKKGHKVTVLTGLPNYPEGKVLKEYKWFKNRRQDMNGIEIRRSSLVGRGTSLPRMFINYAWFAFFASLKALFMKKDFDIVYVFQLSPITMVWPAIVVKKLKRIPLVIHTLDQWPVSLTVGPISKKSVVYKLAEKVSIWTYKKANRIIISSKSFKKYFEDELGISSQKKGLTYYPSYAESVYENVGTLKNDTFDLVFAGNIGPAQDVETIIETANILKNYTNIVFHLVGDGLNKESCEALTQKYNLKNVKFYGYHPVSEMTEYYNLADAFIITMVDNEVVNSTLPAKIQSYMLAGKPIFGAINGEVRAVVEEAKCGEVTSSGNAKELAEIIQKVYNVEVILGEYGENSLKYYFDHFEKEKCIQSLEDIFKEEIGKTVGEINVY
ncbi:MAG: glycosyltransferase family 4 protein [Streptococcaceae bacterium]|nr:glycosyltransferase family 4 protein [Streptococcaceae bacterium]